MANAHEESGHLQRLKFNGRLDGVKFSRIFLLQLKKISCTLKRETGARVIFDVNIFERKLFDTHMFDTENISVEYW